MGLIDQKKGIFGSPCESRIHEKVKNLFAERLLEDQIAFAGLNAKEGRDLLSRMGQVQYWIYILDGYGEQNWNLDRNALATIWSHIGSKVNRITNGTRQGDVLLAGIKEYQAIEIGLRFEVCPLKLALGDFYSKKTCDVRMMRTLICPRPKLEAVLIGMWDFYDLASEALDDLMDLNEDRNTFNCNRFALEAQALGLEATCDHYLAFLREIKLSAGRFSQESIREHGVDTAFVRRLEFVAEKTANMADQATKVLLGMSTDSHLPPRNSKMNQAGEAVLDVCEHSLGIGEIKNLGSSTFSGGLKVANWAKMSGKK